MAHTYRKHPASAATREAYRRASALRSRMRSNPPRRVPDAPDPSDLSPEAWQRRAEVSHAISAQARAGISAPNLDLFPDDLPAPAPAALDLFNGGGA